jgi:hypothetical protein
LMPEIMYCMYSLEIEKMEIIARFSTGISPIQPS